MLVKYKLIIDDISDNDAISSLYIDACVKLPPGDNIVSQMDYMKAVEGYEGKKGDESKYHHTLIWLSTVYRGKLFKWNEEWTNTHDDNEKKYCVVYYNGEVNEYNPEQFIDFLISRVDSNWDEMYKLYMDKLEYEHELQCELEAGRQCQHESDRQAKY